VTTAENPFLNRTRVVAAEKTTARANRMLQIVDHLGLVRYTVLLTIIAVTASSLICFAAYTIIDFDPLAEPVSIIMPILCPLLIVPTITASATRSQLKMREQQLLIEAQNEALERTLSEKDRIISLVGHDLRSQLNLVMGFAQLISRQSESIPAERLADYANEIHHAGAKTNDILNDLLNWGRARAGHLTQSHETEPFDDVVAHVINGLRIEAERKQVEITVSATLPTDEVDRVIMTSALRNILNNAIKFSHSGGTVHVDARRDETELAFTITDTGVGMSSEQLATLRQGQLVTSTEGTSRESGSGLGLTICRDVIEAQGGRLEIESEPGEGTSVTVLIPMIKSIALQGPT
jgi:signal transduction histidine kinase